MLLQAHLRVQHQIESVNVIRTMCNSEGTKLQEHLTVQHQMHVAEAQCLQIAYVLLQVQNLNIIRDNA